MESVLIAKNIIRVAERLENCKSLIGYEKLKGIKAAAERFIKEPSYELGETLANILRSANAHVEDKKPGDHILDCSVLVIEGRGITLSSLLEKLDEHLKKEYKLG